MGLLVGAALTLFSIGIVAFPFFRSRFRSWSKGPLVAAGPEAPEPELIYEAIRILRLEHELGQVPEQLYREQLQGYRLQAANALRERDADPDWALEQEVLAARTDLREAGGIPSPYPKCGAAPLPGGGCPECGEGMDTSGASGPVSS